MKLRAQVCLVTSALALACSADGETTPTTSTGSMTSTSAGAMTSTSSASGSSSGGSGSVGDSSGGGNAETSSEGMCPEGPIGVPECDDYLTDYAICIEENLDGDAKESALEALLVTCEAWLEAAMTEAGKEGLATACQTAYDAVAESCGW